MKYARCAAAADGPILIGSGLLCAGFDPSTGRAEGVIGVSPDLVRFEARPVYEDFGRDVDNMPPDTLELRRLRGYRVRLSGTFRGLIAERTRRVLGGSDRPFLCPGSPDEPVDIWLVGDAGAAAGGYLAIRIRNALSEGLSVTLRDRDAGLCAFELSGLRRLDDGDDPPFEVWMGAPEA